MIIFFLYTAVRVVLNAMAYSREKGMEQARMAVENADLTEEQKQQAEILSVLFMSIPANL